MKTKLIFICLIGLALFISCNMKKKEISNVPLKLSATKVDLAKLGERIEKMLNEKVLEPIHDEKVFMNDENLKRLLRKMLAYDPNERYKDVKAVIYSLKNRLTDII